MTQEQRSSSPSPPAIWVKQEEVARVETKPDQARVTFSVCESKSHNEFLVITQHYTNVNGDWYVAKAITIPMELAFDALNTLATFVAKEYL